jgi:hypothetical protein
MDISHVPFAHHALQGTRNDTEIIKPIINTTVEHLSLPRNNNSNNNDTATTELPFEDGFIFHFMDQTRKQTRKGTCTFKAPYIVHYDATFVETGKPFTLTTLLIPVSAGYSKIIIFSAFGSSSSSKSHNNKTTNPTRNHHVASSTIDHRYIETKPNTTSLMSPATDIDVNIAAVTTTQMERIVNQEKQSSSRRSLVQQFIFYVILPRLPIWFLHTFSNRFLDSDLMLLHDQEINLQSQRARQRLYRENSNIVDDVMDTSQSILKQYFMPSKADRSIVTIRKWISRYASAVYDLSSPSSSTSSSQGLVVPPYKDRTLLFDRYNQHSKHCKHCNTMLETTLPKYKTYSYALLSMSIVLWNRHFLFRLLSIGCVLSFRVYNWIEQTLRHGDFDHSKNH